MDFVIIVIGIALLSVVISYMSIRNDQKKGKHIEEVKKQLGKHRVIYYSSSESSS